MKSIINSAVPLRYCTSPPVNKVVRLEKCPLDVEIKDRLISACQLNRDEVCGFITNDENVLFVPNSHVEPHYNFYMDIADIQEALDIIRKIGGSDVIGMFHTHPTNIPWPSPVDIAGWPNLSLQWRYWIVTNHEVIEWGKPR
jgi:proteasome lid subunit RPN8/RPN11